MRAEKFAAQAVHARHFGTPAYIYDVAALRRSFALLRAAVPEDVGIAYSLKANPHPSLVRALAELGCDLEVSSAAELEAAAPARRPMIFTGPGKSEADLEAAISLGCVLSVESPAELGRVRSTAERIGANPATVEVILRVNPAVGPRLAGISMAGQSQFGFPAALSQEWRAELAQSPLRALGYHVYGGSNLPSVDALVSYFRLALDCIDAVNSVVGLDVRLLDLGGGFPAPYARPGESVDLTGLYSSLGRLFAARDFCGSAERPRLLVESGRYLTATCGTLFSTVQDIKPSPDGTRFVVLDAGVNHIGGMAALRRIPPISAVPLDTAGAGESRAECSARLVGPLCTPLDVLNSQAMLPKDLAIGDLVAIPNVGAYGLTASLLGFLSREPASEIITDAEHLLEATRLSLVRSPL